jgi:hypothetical protein
VICGNGKSEPTLHAPLAIAEPLHQSRKARSPTRGTNGAISGYLLATGYLLFRDVSQP